MVKIVEIIDIIDGIFVVECENYDEAREYISAVKTKYPFAIMNGNGTNTFILNLYDNWGKYVTTELAIDGEETTCVNCGKCGTLRDPSRNSSPGIISDTERCFFEQFWAEVVQNRERHFICNGHAYSFTHGEGGFCGQRWTVEFEDGEVLTDVGLWHRGEVPKSISHLFREATKE